MEIVTDKPDISRVARQVFPKRADWPSDEEFSGAPEKLVPSIVNRAEKLAVRQMKY